MGRRAWLIFAVTTCLLLLLHGNRAVFTNDEGILLEPAQRVALGARPFVDFFGYMSPGSYWWQGIIFRLLGVNILAGRLLTVLDFSAQCALLFWLVARFQSTRAAWMTLALFTVLQTADATVLTAQHRWDSSALALGAIVSVLIARDSDRRWGYVLAGILGLLAAISTPSIALIPCITAIWLLLERKTRALLLLLAGGGTTAIAITAYMAVHQTLLPFLKQMAWLKTNYAEVNIMSYGAVIGGYSNLFKDVSGIGLAIQCGIVFCLILPATLPIVSLLGWGTQLLRNQVEPADRNTMVYLLACMVALIGSAIPRPDVMHLIFVAALPYALTAIWIGRSLSVRQSMLIVGAVSVFSSLFLVHSVTEWADTTKLNSAVGTLRVPREMEPQIAEFLRKVTPGESLYVHPYMPVFYFLTQAHNPTRFAFLAPGMMTTNEEGLALTDLSASPPTWVMFLPLSRGEYLRVFPHATKLNERFEQIEAWIAANYGPAEPAVTISGYTLLRRRN